jgi:predicted secreted Zn-dependent protease
LGIGEGVTKWKLKQDVLFTQVREAKACAIGTVIVNLIVLILRVMGRLNVVKSLIP